MTTITVGPSGRDYNNIIDAIAAGIALGSLTEPVLIEVDAGYTYSGVSPTFTGWNGNATYGWKIRCATGVENGGSGRFALDLQTELNRPGYLEIQDVNITAAVGYSSGNGGVIRDANSQANILRYFSLSNPNNIDVTGIRGSANYRTNAVYDGVVTGFDTGTSRYGVTGVNLAERVTVYNCGGGIIACANVVDCYAGNNTGNDFASNTTVSYSASSDDTATGIGALTGVDPATAFVNAAAGDFTLAALSPLIGAGSTGNNIGYDQITGQEEAPVITSHPTATTVIEGDAESFTILTVGFTGTPTPSVQWQRDNAGDGIYADVSGATSAELTIYGNAVTVADDNGDRYRAAVTNSQGTVYSNPTTLSVIFAPFTIVSGPSSIQRGGSYTFRIDGPNTAPTTGNTTITYAGNALTVDSVTDVGGGVYDIDFTVPAAITLQYSDSVNGWTIDVSGHVAMPWETAFLPPDGWEYVVLVDPDTVNTYSAFYGYSGDTPATGWQWEKQTHTSEGDANYPNGLRVEPEGVAGYMALEAMPLATQTMQHRLIEPDGTLWPLATLTFDIGDDETPDDTPDQSVTGVEPESTVTFTEFTVSGLGDGITVSYTISNGEFAVNSGSGYGSYDGTAKDVQNGYAVTVRHESAAITGGTPGVKTTTLNQNGLLAQFTSTTRAAVAPTITEQPNGSAATSVGAAVTINAAVSNYASLQWRSNGVAIPGATTLPLAFTPAAVGSYSLDFVATSSEGASVTSSAHVVTAIALATRIVIPAGVVTGRGVSMAGQTVTVNVWADDGGKAGEFLYSTSVTLAASGTTNLDSNQNGAAGSTRWYSFPSATGGNSEAFFQATVQAIP